MRLTYALLILLLILLGCAQNKALPPELRKQALLATPGPEETFTFFYRVKRLAGGAINAHLQLDGQHVGKMYAGAVLLRMKPGIHQYGAALGQYSVVRSLEQSGGKIYCVRVENKLSQSGPFAGFDLELNQIEDEAKCRQELAKLPFLKPGYDENAFDISDVTQPALPQNSFAPRELTLAARQLQPKPDKATLILYRPFKQAGSAVAMEFDFDEKFVGRFYQGFFLVEAEAGKHQLEVFTQNRNQALLLDLAKGEVALIRLEALFRLGGPGIDLKRVMLQESAKKELADLELLLPGGNPVYVANDP